MCDRPVEHLQDLRNRTFGGRSLNQFVIRLAEFAQEMAGWRRKREFRSANQELTFIAMILLSRRSDFRIIQLVELFEASHDIRRLGRFEIEIQNIPLEL